MVAASAACLVLGCLPAGEPPAGQQLVSDRTLTAAFFSPSDSDVVPSFLFCTGPYRSGGDFVTSLYAISYGKDAGAATKLASLKPAIEDLAPLFSTAGSSPPTDSLGRLYLTTLVGQDSISSSPEQSHYQITRYDPSTGAREPVPSGTVLRFSRSRSRAFAGGLTAATLFEPEGARPLAGVSGLPVFVGEDLYYVAVPPSDTPQRPPTTSTLTRIRPNAEPEAILATPGYLTILTALQGVEATRLLVQGAVPGLFVLDVATMTSRPLSSELRNFNFESASASGRWLLFFGNTPPPDPTAPPSMTRAIVDATTGTRTDLDWAVFGEMSLDSPSSGEWRPGHDELWLETESGVFTITEPGDLVTALPMGPGQRLAQLPQAGTARYSPFTSDGRHWFSRNPTAGGRVYLGQADDPSAATLPINPEGTWTRPYWEIGDGRLLVGAWADEELRQELYLVDPVAGTSRLLAGGGQVVAVGRTRALALLEWDGARNTGALTLLDLASGASTLLAEEVYAVAVDRGRSVDAPSDAPSDVDALAPGTKIAFLSRGRLASPYDGLWVTELP